MTHKELKDKAQEAIGRRRDADIAKARNEVVYESRANSETLAKKLSKYVVR